MPLVIIVGTPCSGKSTRATQLKEDLERRGKPVRVVSEEEFIHQLGYEKNETYLDSQKEKRLRGALKSEVSRWIGTNNVVILDGSNYIKGYRYELYCLAKASKSTQCTIYTLRNHEEARQSNLERREKLSGCDKDGTSNESLAYTDEVFEALTKHRFEEPNAQSRWDSPLYTVHTSARLDTESIYKTLFENKPPPPNMSTQNPPLSATNFLYDLDQVTQSVCGLVLEARRGQLSLLPGYEDCPLDEAVIASAVSPRLLHLRRQFLTYARQHHTHQSPATLGRHFIRYLNNTYLEGR